MDQILTDYRILAIPSFILAESLYDMILKTFKGIRQKRISHKRTFGTCVSLATICYHFWITNEVVKSLTFTSINMMIWTCLIHLDIVSYFVYFLGRRSFKNHATFSASFQERWAFRSWRRSRLDVLGRILETCSQRIEWDFWFTIPLKLF